MSKIIVGMSGGVDSSVSAYLLQKQGYQVEGLFMRNWDSALNNDILGNKTNNNKICSQEQDYKDAFEVAKQLNLKLHRVDFIDEYWNEVFLYFLSEYKSGRTPNPDILCNKYIKFDAFLKYAINELHADKIAMGHYAQVCFNNQINQYQLLKGKDLSKDQTYFLCQLNQNQLSKVLFPIGNLTKKEVRTIANEKGLLTANKKDSTGICFIGPRKFQEFLSNYLPNQPGKIIDISNNQVIGEHIGIMYYTIGQRKGLNLGGMSEPYFVVGKNFSEKILYVAPLTETKWLSADACDVVNVNWINNDIEKQLVCFAKFRYRQGDEKIKITKKVNGYHVTFDRPIRAITPGQAAVFYQNNICLGGGTITNVYQKNQKLWYL